ncbi:hypothetical protein L7F22_002222 [Adiantum nelumboides]|nr:hypothetical protein [Adiantum nelumboides]
MTIYPLSSASWPAKQHSSSAVVESPCSYGQKREMQMYPSLCRGSPRQWELRRIASLPVLDADDYWSDASLSLPHLASGLPQSEEKEMVFAPPCSPNEDTCRCSGATRPMRSQNLVEEPIKATSRCSTFPSPLESPAHLRCEGRYPNLQTVEKVCFTYVRSNGRLLVLEKPVDIQPWRHLRLQRHNGRLVLQLHVESSSTEVELDGPLVAGVEESDPIETESNPIAEDVTGVSLFAQNAKERRERVKKANPYSNDEEGEVAEEEDTAEGGEKLGNGKVSLYTKVLKTLECDAFSDSTEACSPINQLHLKYGRSSGVASFLHKSLTRVRPLNMLPIWQTLPIQT